MGAKMSGAIQSPVTLAVRLIGKRHLRGLNSRGVKGFDVRWSDWVVAADELDQQSDGLEVEQTG